jgi:hypothetical protein
MSSENADFAVGVIAIELLADNGRDRGTHFESDATLGEFLIQLASDGAESNRAFDTGNLGSLPAGNHRFGGRISLSAKLENLAAELDLAVAQVRRRIAAAAQQAT